MLLASVVQDGLFCSMQANWGLGEPTLLASGGYEAYSSSFVSNLGSVSSIHFLKVEGRLVSRGVMIRDSEGTGEDQREDLLHRYLVEFLCIGP